MDLLSSSPTMPAGGSKQEAGFLCTAKNTTETPGSKWWELTNRIKTDSSHTIWWKDKRKEINMIWNNHSQEVTDFWLQPQSRTPEDKLALLGSESPVAQPDIPILRFTSKEQLRTRPCVELPHSNKFRRCVSSPLNTATHPPPPPIFHLSTCYCEYWVWEYASGLRMGDIPSTLALPLRRPCVPPSHPKRSQPLPVTNKGD